MKKFSLVLFISQLCLSITFMASFIVDAKQEESLSPTTIQGSVVKLNDSTGLVYVGMEIPKKNLQPYLLQLKAILGEQQYKLFRANQIKRDEKGFHLTLINPFEYQKLVKDKKAILLGQQITVKLQGLGTVAETANDINKKVKTEQAQTYFVIISSADGEKYRQHYALKAKDFHSTLGFNPHDIYTKSKGLERLVK